MGPPADGPAVPPHGRADVAVPVEQRGAVLAEELLAVRPAHRRRVEQGQQRGLQLRGRGGSRSSGSIRPVAPSRSTSTVPRRLHRYRELGVAEVLCDIPTAPGSEILPILDKYADACGAVSS